MFLADVYGVAPFRAMSGWLVVAGASSCFGVVAGIVTWGAAAQRRGAWVAGVPQMYEEQVASLAHLRVRFPNMTSDLDQRAMSNYVPEPTSALGAMGSQVLVQTLFFAAVCGLMVVLNLRGRPIWAFLAPAVVVVGMAGSAGPLALLSGTLGGPLTATPVPGISYVYFSAPLWWRLTTATVTALVFAGAWFVTRRPQQRKSVEFGKTLSALGLFVLAVEATVLMVPQTLVPDNGTIGETFPTTIVLLVVGCCGAVAGSAGSLRRGAATAAAVMFGGAAVWIVAWLVYRNADGRGIFAWEQAPGTPILWLGTWQLVVLVLAAGGLGCAAVAVQRVLAARRASGLTMLGHGSSSGFPV
jgi:hypothetical protein